VGTATIERAIRKEMMSFLIPSPYIFLSEVWYSRQVEGIVKKCSMEQGAAETAYIVITFVLSEAPNLLDRALRGNRLNEEVVGGLPAKLVPGEHWRTSCAGMASQK
jgi:hypothetical protein